MLGCWGVLWMLAAAQAQILGGSPAQWGEFPHQAAVLGPAGWQCDGALVSPQAVLTTATCCQYQVEAVEVGSLASSGRVVGEVITVERVEQHQDWDPVILHSDLCLLTLAWPANTTGPDVGPARLPSAAPVPGAECEVAGWGTGPTLSKVPLPVVSAQQCDAVMAEFGLQGHNQ